MKKTIYNCIITLITTFKQGEHNMSDSKLLAENTIRRFMKLANVDTMTDNFISEKYNEDNLEEQSEEVNEEEVELEEVAEEDPMPEEEAEESPEMDMDMGEVEPEDAEPEMGAADMSLTEEEASLLIDLGQRLASAMGPADAPEEDPDMDMEADIDSELAVDAPEEEEAPAKMYEGEQEDLVNEILKRVTKRLVAQRRK
jgi:hypothetical protein